MKRYKVPISFVVEVTEQDLYDIMDMACDKHWGIGHWCGDITPARRTESGKIEKVPLSETPREINCVVDALFHPDYGFLIMDDIEDGNEYILSRNSLLEGVKKYLCENPHIIQSEDFVCDLDAPICDMIVQYGAFGRLVFC